MGVAYNRGQSLGQSDLNIFLRNAAGQLQDAYSIVFSIYDYSTGLEILMPPADMAPVKFNTGSYYAPWQVPGDAPIGTYRIRWKFVEASGAPEIQAVEEFAVVGMDVQTVSSAFTGAEQHFIHRMRVLLRDNNPDRNYHFRPPTEKEIIQGYTENFGFYWEDYELLEYCLIALDEYNLREPPTGFTLQDVSSAHGGRGESAILWGGVARAAAAAAFNWIIEEFDYSISGVSLSLEKSSKYQAMKDNAEASFDKIIEAKPRFTRYMKGLMQHRFGVGISSAYLGPHTGRGILTARKYVSPGWA